MDLHTPVCDLLCCETPIVLAGMGGVARSELVAAVTEAGGFGFLGMVRESATFIHDEIEAVRARTTRPFGVNLIPAATPLGLLEAELEACIEARVHAVTLFWDLKPAIIARLRDAGILVICQVGSAAEALAAQDAGADLVIAQGWGAGGHVRGGTALASLLAEVVAQVDVPVLAAGGIVDGAGMAAAMILGAQGVLVGTAFLATDESFAHDYHKRRIAEALADTTIHTDAFHVNWPAGAHVRVLPNSVTQGLRGDPFGFHKEVIGAEGDRPIHLFSTDSPLRSMTGDFEAMALYAGQGAGRISAIIPAGDRLRNMAQQARAILYPQGPAHPRGMDEPAELNSPACFAATADAAYMGFAARDELVSELNVLLEAERAGARVAARLVADAGEPDLRRLAKVIHADEVKWCRALFRALTQLKVEPSLKVGDFYENAMAIKDVKARLAFVNRGQGWVVRKLRDLLPRVRDDDLHAMLREMLEAHEANIASAEETLARGEARV
jgi:nitronate monooxygenase